MFDCKGYHSEFRPLEVTRHTLLTDKMIMKYYELPKVPEAVSADNELELWLALFKANTAEEMERIKAMDVPVMKEAIAAYHATAASKEFLELERLRSKAAHDEAQAIYNAEKLREQLAERK